MGSEYCKFDVCLFRERSDLLKVIDISIIIFTLAVFIITTSVFVLLIHSIRNKSYYFVTCTTKLVVVIWILQVFLLYIIEIIKTLSHLFLISTLQIIFESKIFRHVKFHRVIFIGVDCKGKNGFFGDLNQCFGSIVKS